MSLILTLCCKRIQESDKAFEVATDKFGCGFIIYRTYVNDDLKSCSLCLVFFYLVILKKTKQNGFNYLGSQSGSQINCI